MLMTDTPVGPLLKTVFGSILEVFLQCLAGYILATRGVLDKKTQKQLNRLNVSLFTPCLLFSKVAFFLSPAKLRELWIIPIFFVITTVASMIVAYVLSLMFGLKKSQRSFAIAASMFMNSNSLPIALMQSLVITVPGLKWGADDNIDAMVGRALTYLVLYSTLGMVLRWSYGVRLLSNADPDGSDHEPCSSPLIEAAETALLNPQEEQTLRYETSSLSLQSDDTRAGDAEGADHSKSQPNSRAPSPPPHLHETMSNAPSLFNDAEDMNAEEIEFITRREITEPTSSAWQSRMRRMRNRMGRWWFTFYEFMTVPLWAALASLIVASIQPLQHILEKHVQPVKGALTAAGNCSIPLTLVVLGAYFYTPSEIETRLPSHHRPVSQGPTSRSPSSASRMSLFENVKEIFSMKRRDKGAMRQKRKVRKRPGETRTVLVAVVSRMIVTPLLLLPLMAMSTKLDLQEVFDDPVFVVSNVLLIASPPALTLAQITQAASGDAFERLISRTVFWSYCVVTPPSTIIFIVIGLLFAKL